MRPVRALLAVILLCGVIASTNGGRAQAQAPATFTLAPGGRATVTYEAFCTNYGAKFPTTLQAPNALASDQVRGALAYLQANNLGANPEQALEAQYGVWRVTGATDSPRGGAVADAVANAAQRPPADLQGISLLDAVNNNQVRLTLGSWQPVGEKVQIGSATDNFYGRGELTVENISQQQLTLYLPVGTLFPPATAGEQTMAAYAINAQVQNPQPTAQPTAQAAGQATQATELPATSGGATQLVVLLTGFALLAAAGVVRALRRTY